MSYNNDLNSSDILETFDFEQFLTNEGDFNFDAFEPSEGIDVATGS